MRSEIINIPLQDQQCLGFSLTEIRVLYLQNFSFSGVKFDYSLSVHFNKYSIPPIGYPYMMYNRSKQQKTRMINTYFQITSSVEIFCSIFTIPNSTIKFPQNWHPFKVGQNLYFHKNLISKIIVWFIVIQEGLFLEERDYIYILFYNFQQNSLEPPQQNHFQI